MKCFFFQAEDGIRGAQESHGIGDVYKRQENTLAKMKGELKSILINANKLHLSAYI